MPHPLAKPTEPVIHDAWQCCWQDKNGKACPAHGTLDQRIGLPYARHVCQGHGKDRDLTRKPDVFILCLNHFREFNAVHGLDDEPDWLRKRRIAKDYEGGARVIAPRYGA